RPPFMLCGSTGQFSTKRYGLGSSICLGYGWASSAEATSTTKAILVISPSDDLHADPFRILYMEARIQVVFRRRPTRLQLQCDLIPVELLDRYRKVIHYPHRTLMVERHQRLPCSAEPHDFVRLVLAHHGQPEHLLIKRNRSRQIADLYAH